MKKLSRNKMKYKNEMKQRKKSLNVYEPNNILFIF